MSFRGVNIVSCLAMSGQSLRTSTFQGVLHHVPISTELVVFISTSLFDLSWCVALTALHLALNVVVRRNRSDSYQ